jgi:GT2 family glycosyltransferase
MGTPGRTTAVVVAWQAADRLGPCLAALTSQPGVAVLVVDNASTDRTREVVAAHPEVRLLEAGANLGFAGGCSLGLAQVATPFAALVNDDAVVRPGWAAALEAELDAHPDCALVTGKVLLRDGRVNSAGGLVDRYGRGADRGFGAPAQDTYLAAEEVFFAPATACLVRMSDVRAVGLLDARYFLYYEDVDLAWRLRLTGRTVRYTPGAVADHDHGASSGAGSRSTLHAFHDSRNRLLTLAKDATAGRALGQAVRLPLTAASLTGRALRGGAPEGRAAALRHASAVGRAWLSFLRLLPHVLRERRRVGRSAVLTRSAVEQQAASFAGDRW